MGQQNLQICYEGREQLSPFSPLIVAPLLLRTWGSIHKMVLKALGFPCLSLLVFLLVSWGLAQCTWYLLLGLEGCMQ